MIHRQTPIDSAGFLWHSILTTESGGLASAPSIIVSKYYMCTNAIWLTTAVACHVLEPVLMLFFHC